MNEKDAPTEGLWRRVRDGWRGAGALSALSALAVLGSFSPPAAAQCQEDKLSEAGFTGYGYAAAMSGDVAVIGEFSAGPGTVFVYHRTADVQNRWVLTQTLTPTGGEAADFGFSVDIDGDTIVVGDPRDDSAGPLSDYGAVYVYGRNQGGPDNWGLVKKIYADDALTGGATIQLGSPVAINGDTIVATAALDDDAGPSNAGSVYVFERNLGGSDNWGQADELLSSTPSNNDNFGFGLDIDGDTIGVGRQCGDPMEVFHRIDGVWTSIIDVPMVCDGGEQISISGSVLVTGRPDRDGAFVNQGAAQIFGRDTGGAENWGLLDDVTNAAPSSGAMMGQMVGVSGDLLLAGATGDDQLAMNAGAALIYQRFADNWLFVAKFTEPGGAASLNYGATVAISGTLGLVAHAFASSADDVSMLNLLGADCNENGICDDLDIANELASDANENGIPDQCECDADLDHSGDVGFGDLTTLLLGWGPCPPKCPNDLDNSGNVGFGDLTVLLLTWGPC